MSALASITSFLVRASCKGDSRSDDLLLHRSSLPTEPHHLHHARENSFSIFVSQEAVNRQPILIHDLAVLKRCAEVRGISRE